jgi:hypothetical protein
VRKVSFLSETTVRVALLRHAERDRTTRPMLSTLVTAVRGPKAAPEVRELSFQSTELAPLSWKTARLRQSKN